MGDPESHSRPGPTASTPRSDGSKEPRGAGSEPDTPASDQLIERLRSQGHRGARYKLLGEIARGGMGAILEIWDADLRRRLAMKVVLGKDDPAQGETPEVAPNTLDRFLEEAQVTGQLDHPGIVPVHELGLAADGRVYFTMRLVKGEDLSRIFEQVSTGRDGWTQLRALGVMLKVCEAMSYAHSKQVIHRDLKPANVMIGKFGEVYVMDWGLSRVLGREDKHDLRLQPQPPTQSLVRTERREKRAGTPDSPLITMDGDVVGTPSFMSPEQAKGQLDKLGPPSDVYAVGAMLYQLISGQMPFVPSDARVSGHTILMRLLEGPPKPLHELAPQTTAELIAIVEKAMAREIADRYPTMRALAEDLRAYIEGRVVHAYETGAWAEARKWVLRNRALAVSLAALVVILIGGVVTSTLFAARATEKAAALEQAKAEAEQKTQDVLSLSAQKDLDELVARAQKLWPADTGMIPEYESWLREARELIDGRPADPATNSRRRPSLEEHKAKLAELRLEAKPWTEEQAKAQRECHPKYAELQTKQAELTWRSRMLGLEPWQSESEVEGQLSMEGLPGDANELNALARSLVAAARPAYGSEMKARLLAMRALAAASEQQRGWIRDTLAWSLFRLSRFDEALAEEQAAVAETGGDELLESAVELESAISSWGAEELTKRRVEREALAADVALLERAVSERLSFEYDDPQARWWEVQLSKLVADLEALRDAVHGLMGDTLAEPFGWGVTRRHEFAKHLMDRSVEGTQAQRAWAEAIAAVKSSTKYGGLELKPQQGLLPIGLDPDSGLMEFAHLQTGEPVARGADGKLILTEAAGLVFVLIPSGRFWMGAQRADPHAENYDPQAEDDEAPVHSVELSPYFLSKYEMTQAQWVRITARNPSFHGPERYSKGWNRDGRGWSGLHPVEQVSWNDCMALMERVGLSLPSEAQWEYGCRAGTSTPFWSGSAGGALSEIANVADAYAKTHGGENEQWENWDDGNTCHAEVGQYRANAFGLHDAHGNVWEWCLDGDNDYRGEPVKNPVSPWLPNVIRMHRGGCFDHVAAYARSAYRRFNPPEFFLYSLGLRPARAIAP